MTFFSGRFSDDIAFFVYDGKIFDGIHIVFFCKYIVLSSMNFHLLDSLNERKIWIVKMIQTLFTPFIF